MVKRTLVRRMAVVGLLAALFVSLAVQPQVSRADSPTYYPETGHYLGGGFRDFWNKNGGLPIFGYPITEEYRAENGRTTQWFERARLELAPNGAIELGLLGKEATIDRVFPQVPPQKNDANHRYFPQTGHVVMWGFKTIWETKGGLALFGYPISEEIDETLAADGKWHIVQYFERARFEYWPEFAEGKRVLISDLGRRLAPRELTAPLPPGSPPGSPAPAPAPAPAPNPTLPPNINASVTPPSGPAGTVFAFNAFGLQAGENVALWVTAPDKSVAPVDFEVIADPDGSITSSGITFRSIAGLPTGIWAITAQGKSSGKAGVGFFEITGNRTNPPPPGALPNDQNARVEPREGQPGTNFKFFAGGFVGSEVVTSGVFNSRGELISNVLEIQADANGSLDYAGLSFQSSESTPPDVYQIYAIGTSGREAFAHFRINPRSSASLAVQATGPVQRPAPDYGVLTKTAP